MNLLRNNFALGVVLYPWEARVFTGDDIAGFAYEKTYYQVLVDNRDADELPMELETLRISEDTTRNPSDVKVSLIFQSNFILEGRGLIYGVIHDFRSQSRTGSGLTSDWIPPGFS